MDIVSPLGFAKEADTPPLRGPRATQPPPVPKAKGPNAPRPEGGKSATEAATVTPADVKLAAMDHATIKSLILGGLAGGGLGAGLQAWSTRPSGPGSDESHAELMARQALARHEQAGPEKSYLAKVRGSMLRSGQDIATASKEHPLAASLTAAVPMALGGAAAGKQLLPFLMR